VPASPELIARIPLFEGLSARERQSVAQSFKERKFTPGEVVAAEGSGGIGFFVIGEGEADVSARGDVKATLGPGSYFGEIALIDDGARTATITAKTDLTCYGMTSWDFRPLVETNASIAWKLLQTLAKRLREAQAELNQLETAS
jgi:CRP/FNR family transcriptional regulator, cyclic AMP receptor protein